MMPMAQALSVDGIETLNTAVAPGERRLAILGATGTIGRNTIDVISCFPDRFPVEVVTANRNAAQLAKLARAVGAKRAIVADDAAYAALKSYLAGSGIVPEAGAAAMCDAISAPVDTVMAGIVGTAGLETAYRAASSGMTLALANKECLVAAAPLFRAAAERSGASIVPIDSEHSAVFQALARAEPEMVESVTLTASGGPFRTWSRAQMATVTPRMAVQHPNWSMGAKISVDSATLMNKGLELIEAAALFPFAADRLSVLIHPQSIVHGLVGYRDGSVIAQLSAPDMRIPIAVGLAWPNRLDLPSKRLDLSDLARLDFDEPDRERFPALRLAESALAQGPLHCLVLNAANEVAVDHFLRAKLPFLKIAEVVAEVLERFDSGASIKDLSTISDVLNTDENVRKLAGDVCRRFLGA